MKNENILDIIIFGSAIKGKEHFNDLDLAIVFKELDRKIVNNLNEKAKEFNFELHISEIMCNDFFENPSTLITTLLREGFSLRNNKFLAECYRFNNVLMYIYQLKGMKESEKVKFIYLLKGRNGKRGFVEKNNGKWLAKQVLIFPLEKENDMEEILKRFRIKYQKYFLLMH